MAKKKKVFLIDGSALLYRSYFAFIRNPLINSKGVNTSAVYGFASTLMKILKTEKPDYISVVFDAPEPTFRHEKYPLYKATREKMPDELIEQIPIVEEIIEAFNIPLFRISGIEADDLIGTLACRSRDEGCKVFIVTADKDFFQIVSDDVKIYNLRAKEKDGSDRYIDAKRVKEKLGVTPDQIIDYLSIVGDSSDNVPGVKGIGAKTAEKLLNAYSSVEEVMEDLENIKPDGLRKKLESGKNDLLLSRDLVTIRTQIPVDKTLDDIKILPWNRNHLGKLFHEYEFVSLLKDVSPTEEEEILSYVIANKDNREEIVQKILSHKEISFDITFLKSEEISIFGVSFSSSKSQAFFFPFIDEDKNENSKSVKKILEDASIAKICHDAKKQMHQARILGMAINGISFDTMLASFLLDPSTREPGLPHCSLQYIDFHKKTFEELTGKSLKKILPLELNMEDISHVSMENADIAYRLYPVLKKALRQRDMSSLYFDLEMPLIPVLFQMEVLGIMLDVPFLKELSQEVSQKIFDLEKEIYKETGLRFNLNSPKQLGEVLFDTMQIQSVFPNRKVKKSKTGYSTAFDVLNEYRNVPLVSNVLKHRSLSKLKNTYVDVLPQLCSSADSRLHTDFHQAITQTGRLSSTDPNLQNIPIRSEMGSLIRKAFVAREDHFLVCADYSQIELRILAHLSGDEKLISAFEKEKDIHTQTASLIFHIDEADITPGFRSKAKAINFGIIYGMGPRKLSMDTGITFKEAQAFINEYFLAYPGIKVFIDETIAKTKENENVSTLLGRIRRIPEIVSSNPRLRSAGENMAVNTPVQGSAADIIKLAMLKVEKAFNENHLTSRMLLQVHDELIFEVKKEELEAAVSLIRESMMDAYSLKVPLVVKIKSGLNWLEAH